MSFSHYTRTMRLARFFNRKILKKIFTQHHNFIVMTHSTVWFEAFKTKFPSHSKDLHTVGELKDSTLHRACVVKPP